MYIKNNYCPNWRSIRLKTSELVRYLHSLETKAQVMQNAPYGEQSHVYDHLMVISQKALETGHYEVAYHALAAAMHYARDESNIERLARVETIAQAQQDWIDARDRKHWMSRQSATQRGVKSLYDTLARQARAHEIIVEQEYRREHTND